MNVPPEKKQWLCIIPDKPGMLSKRLEVRQTHLTGLKPLLEADRVVIGGPMFHESHPVEGQTPQFKGSMMIFRGTSAEEVREILNNDVYAKNEVWDMENTQIIPVMMLV